MAGRGWLAAGLMGAAAAALVALATNHHGPGLSPDSAVYLSTADSLAHGHGFRAYGDVPLTDFPPGYPLALAGWLEAVGGGTAEAARAVNAAAVFALVVLAALVMRRYVTRGLLWGMGVLLVACAPAALHTGVTAWSEPVFSALIMASLLFLVRALSGWRTLDVALAGALAGACVAVRFVGVAVVLAGLAALVADGRWRRPRPDLVRRCALFVGMAALAPAAWVASRLTITDSPLGVRKPPRADFFQNAKDALAWIVHWFVPDTFPGPVRILGYLLAAALVGAAAVLATRAGRARLRPVPRGHPAAPLWLLALMAASLVAVTVVASSLTETDRLDFRLLSPALGSAVVLVVGAGDRLLDRVPGRAPLVVAAVFFGAWLAASVAADPRVWRDARQGEGYASAEWRASGLSALLRTLPANGPLYSNQPDAAWLLAGRDARCPPAALARGPCGGLSVPADEHRAVRTPAELAWFGRPPGPVAAGGSAGCRLSRLATRRDGALFRVDGTACGAA